MVPSNLSCNTHEIILQLLLYIKIDIFSEIIYKRLNLNYKINSYRDNRRMGIGVKFQSVVEFIESSKPWPVKCWFCILTRLNLSVCEVQINPVSPDQLPTNTQKSGLLRIFHVLVNWRPSQKFFSAIVFVTKYLQAIEWNIIGIIFLKAIRWQNLIFFLLSWAVTCNTINNSCWHSYHF